MGIFRQSYPSAHRIEETIFLKESSIQLTNDYGDKKLRRQLIAMSIKTIVNWSLMPWNFTWVFWTRYLSANSFKETYYFRKKEAPD